MEPYHAIRLVSFSPPWAGINPARPGVLRLLLVPLRLLAARTHTLNGARTTYGHP
jgi:hypothetical protein